MPWDCDFYGHVNNSRYFSFMDLGRIDFGLQTRSLKVFMKNKWGFILAGSAITFVRPLQPFQAFTLSTEVLSWDEKYIYLLQQIRVKDKIHATALMKMATQGKKGVILPTDVIKTLGLDPHKKPVLPETVNLLRQLSTAKRNLHS
jgi:acyl-CoA thioesterase FadM